MITHYLLLSLIVFCIGLLVVIVKKNAIMILIGIEIMINAANINLIAFSRYLGGASAQLFALFSIALAAAEVAIGLAIIILVYRRFSSIDVTELKSMRW
ncbi:MAG: NADH-quinone oxidoreductase subunit NuoK [Candidatus Methanofastidiosia archaeon]